MDYLDVDPARQVAQLSAFLIAAFL